MDKQKNIPDTTVHEAAAAYRQASHMPHGYMAPRRSNGMFSTYKNNYSTAINLLNASNKGLPAQAALDFIAKSGFTARQFQQVFNTTVKTVNNYKAAGQPLDATLSEKLLKVFALFDEGVQVFGSADEFIKWLHLPAYGLGMQAPIQLMSTITGISLIADEVTRIAYGDLA